MTICKYHYSTYLPPAVKRSLEQAAMAQRTGGCNGAVALILESLGAHHGDHEELAKLIAQEILFRHARLVPHMLVPDPPQWERVGLVVEISHKLAIEKAADYTDLTRGRVVGHLLVGVEDEFVHRIASARSWRMSQGRFPEISSPGASYRPAQHP